MSQDTSNRQEDPRTMLRAIQRRLRVLTVAVMLLTLVLGLTCATVFGYLLNYFSTDPMMLGGTLIGAALLGFAFGWVARRHG